ncbi:hypothetical protein ONA91_32695 [Micromonospora sp. DR5-3]|uniref:hypothetical protein n=1 Tax=unclassified Micromonospora TaxID=2617518 RepID=UPI0011D3B6FD|nr:MULTISPECIES: hypothetical protein [unclassified Micromonospora]MCW3819211.1 hypothetical protein [Micromonospora sp. DR5-3]TYC20741.1 hypothetical protein FXF52_29720 [Micromonospora sp. MP36]
MEVVKALPATLDAYAVAGDAAADRRSRRLSPDLSHHLERGPGARPAAGREGEQSRGGDPPLTSRAGRPPVSYGDLGDGAGHGPHPMDRARGETMQTPGPDVNVVGQRTQQAAVPAQPGGQAEPHPDLTAVHHAGLPAHPPVTIGEIHVHQAAPVQAPPDPLSLLSPYAGGLTARRGPWANPAGAR